MPRNTETSLLLALEQRQEALVRTNEDLEERLERTLEKLNKSRCKNAEDSTSLSELQKENAELRAELQRSYESRELERQKSIQLSRKVERLRTLLTNAMIEMSDLKKTKASENSSFLEKLGKEGIQMIVAESQPGMEFQPKIDAYTERGLFETLQAEQYQAKIRQLKIENQAVRTKLDAAIKKNVNRDTVLHRDFKAVRSQVVAKQMQLNGALRRIQYLLGETKKGNTTSKNSTTYVARLETTVAELTQELKASRKKVAKHEAIRTKNYEKEMSTRLRDRVRDMHKQNRGLLDLPTELTWDHIYSDKDLVEKIKNEKTMNLEEEKDEESDSDYSVDLNQDSVLSEDSQESTHSFRSAHNSHSTGTQKSRGRGTSLTRALRLKDGGDTGRSFKKALRKANNFIRQRTRSTEQPLAG